MTATPLKTIDVVGVCNALVDLLIHVKQKDLEKLKLSKGIMHLVSSTQQEEILKYFAQAPVMQEIGGSTLNLIRVLARLNQKTVFTGMVGRDVFGRSIKDRLHKLGIVGKVYDHDTQATGSCIVLVTPDGERTMNTHLGASQCYNATHLPAEEIKKSKFLHFCGYQWDGNEQRRCILEAIAVAKKYGTKVSFDLADPFVVRNHRDDFLSLIRKYADVVFANREEALILQPGEPLEKIAQAIANSGAIAVIKRGADGALIVDGRQGAMTKINIPPHPIKVIDTTGAGDTFAAGFLYGLVNDKSLESCGKIAAILATDVISRMGVQWSDEAFAKVEQFPQK